jgi:hypothetical protein
MKSIQKSLSTALFVLMGTAMFAQSGPGFGLKGGLNYNANGDYFESAGDAARDPGGNIGYHIGLFAKFGEQIYVRPELIYTRTTSDYDGSDFKMGKLDVPVLIGLKVIGPLHVFAGPAFQYILDTEFDGITINDVENDFSVGLHIGAGLSLGKVGVDLRYERGLSNNEARFINTNITNVPNSRIDTRPNQLILSLSLKL